jgi:hypothetical protein
MWPKKPDCQDVWKTDPEIRLLRGVAENGGVCRAFGKKPGSGMHIWIKGTKKTASMGPKGILSMKSCRLAAFRKQEGRQQCGSKFTFEAPVGLKSCAKRRFQSQPAGDPLSPGLFPRRGGLTGLECQKQPLERLHPTSYGRAGPAKKARSAPVWQNAPDKAQLKANDEGRPGKGEA